MPDVFISYSHVDEDFARRVHDALVATGRVPTWDRDQAAVPFSSPWRSEIRRAIESSDKFVFVISPRSLESPQCAIEIGEAQEAGKQLIPLLYRHPREGQEMPDGIERLNWISFSGNSPFESSMGHLVSALDTDLAWAKSHTRLTVRAVDWAQGGRDRSLLLRGSDLRSAESWAADGARYPQSPATTLQREYISASRRLADVSARLWRGGLAAGLAIALVLALFAFIERAQAIGERNQAIQQAAVATSLQLAARSELLDTSDPATAAQLAAAAWMISPTAQAQESMLEAFAQPERGIVTRNSAGGIAFSPDGKMLATADPDGAVWLWDPATRHQIGRPFTFRGASAAGPGFMAFGPGGKILAVGYSDGTVRLWDVASRHRVGATLFTAAKGASTTSSATVAFSPDGKLLVTTESYGSTSPSISSVRLWDVATGRQLGRPITMISDSAEFTDALFSPDGKTLVTAGPDAQFWNVPNLRQIGAPIPGGLNGFDAVAISHNGKLLATAGADGPAQLWNMTSHHQVGKAIPASGAQLLGVAFSPSDTILATANIEGQAQLWNVTTHSPVGLPMTFGSSVTSLAFSPDGKTLAASSDDGTARLWDIALFYQIGASLHQAENLSGIALSPDGNRLATAGVTVRLWNVATHRQIGAPIAAPSTPQAVAFSPDGNMLATVTFDGKAQLWDVTTHRQIGASMTAGTGNTEPSAVAFSPDGRILATVNTAARLWSVASQRPIGPPLGGAMDAEAVDAEAVAFSRSGRIVATANQDDTVRLWDVATGRQIGKAMIAGGQDNSAVAVAFSPDGKIVASASEDGTVKLWDAVTHRQVGVPMIASSGRGPVAGTNGVAFSPNGSILATAGGDGTVRLWDVSTQRQLGPAMTAPGGATAVTYEPSGMILASLNFTDVQFWNVAFPHDLLPAVCSIAGSPLTREQWAYYVKVVPYHAAC